MSAHEISHDEALPQSTAALLQLLLPHSTRQGMPAGQCGVQSVLLQLITQTPPVQVPLAALQEAALHGGAPLPPLPALPPALLPAVAAPPWPELPPLELPLLALPALPPLGAPLVVAPAEPPPLPACPPLGVLCLPPAPAVGSTTTSSTQTRAPVSQTQPLKPSAVQSVSRLHCCGSSLSSAEHAAAVTAKAVLSRSWARFITLQHSLGFEGPRQDSLRALAAFLLTRPAWTAMTVPVKPWSMRVVWFRRLCRLRRFARLTRVRQPQQRPLLRA